MGHLTDFQERANRAFDGTSFEPEKRGASFIAGYESELDSDLSQIAEPHHGEYIERFRAKVSEIITARTGVLSSMITGPARFPAARNQRRSARYERLVTEFEDWRVYSIKKYNKQDHDALPQSAKDDEEFQSIKQHLYQCAATIKSGFGNKALFVSSAYNKIETLAKNGKTEMVKRAFETLKELEEKGCPIFTSRHKVWKLVDVATTRAEKSAEKAAKESKEFEFDGHNLVYNYAEDRLQIIYPGKPDYRTIQSLKENGFRWSPTFGAWQRQLTQNSIYSYNRLMGRGWDSPELKKMLAEL